MSDKTAHDKTPVTFRGAGFELKTIRIIGLLTDGKPKT